MFSYSGLACRICHEDGIKEELISPCACAGSVGLAHAKCIEQWLSSSNTTNCEICKYQYNISIKSKSFLQWLKNKNPLNGPSGFYGDVFCFVLLTPLCIGSVYLCAVGAHAYIKHGLWEGTGLAMLCCFLTAVYILWCFVAFRFHWKRFRSWQATNKTVRLLPKHASA
ncbi:membrane-associated RING finger protein, putative [Pediculus humanus corporis]|uniref:Membrane-associated RING finger protein, putative n=1 Tax=Pediculus humanus subsp. corporis TaxID=121224 RepID=E0VJM6_PEDHC|nr:membrane-associated RING finger protein, putative [Pediculus humanus corporis]EEB13582.1 membrane-associated RING finger protein, putative [Pediculus humanus corporis]